ncbi:flagellar hook-length control protein FliK [Bosea sp. 124]|uniref:flagellar hook-length control protein FliK n=1 Tax=Bosea sp. 124 TaxID=2135642 RepID=UPI000D348AA8|nr:flagellar hook-length control protein FliK [Bosea sp. 124]PTM40654.1 flagellar hook-length control protein FliK [Bosea sp. 124]
MSNLETPFLPPGRAPGAAGAEAAKNPKTRLMPGGRDERGQAFRNLLQNLDKTTGKAASPMPGKAADAAPAEAGESAEGQAAELLPDALVPTVQTEPAAGASDAARLLLGALQAPAPGARPDGRKEPGPRRDAFATLNSALAKAGTGMPADKAAGAVGPAAGEPGIALPSDKAAPAELPGIAGLADLAGLTEAVEAAPARAGAAAGDVAPETPMTITVVRQETHLPPVLRLSPLQQVTEPIRQAAAELTGARADAVPDLHADRPAGIAEPTKILHIQLAPVELGSITVKLRISQGGMEIRLEASRAETAQMLANDRDALREIVKASGYALDQVSVETVHVDIATPDPRPGGQGHARDTGADDRSGAREGRGFDQSRERQDGRREDREPQSHDRRQDATTSKEESHEPRERSRPGRNSDRYL